jgi:hypothetical protein
MIRFREGRPPPIYKVSDEHPPLVLTNGVLAWILPEEELRLFCGLLELADDDEWRNSRPIFQPLVDFGDDRMPNYERHIFRMMLGQGVLATISGTITTQIKGTSLTAGNTISYAVHHHRDSLELTGVFTASEVVTNTHFHAPDPGEIVSLRTNFVLAATMQIPRGNGVFFCDTNQADARHRNIGIVIRPKVK